MGSDSSSTPTKDITPAGAKDMTPAGEPRPTFWRDLYWFGLICLGAWIVAVAILPPRLARNRRSYELEKALQGVNAQLAEKERQYEAAIAAMENDPYYREAVYRHVLQVKKSDEEFLKRAGGVSDNDEKTVKSPGDR